MYERLRQRAAEFTPIGLWSEKGLSYSARVVGTLAVIFVIVGSADKRNPYTDPITFVIDNGKEWANQNCRPDGSWKETGFPIEAELWKRFSSKIHKAGNFLCYELTNPEQLAP